MKKTISLLTILMLIVFISCDTTTSSTSTVPELTTHIVSAITSRTASCGGTIVSNGGETVIVRGVCWSTSQTPTISDDYTSDGNGVGDFLSEMSGLSSDTKYFVRAYATNSVGTGYGNVISFTTPYSNPICNDLYIFNNEPSYPFECSGFSRTTNYNIQYDSNNRRISWDFKQECLSEYNILYGRYYNLIYNSNGILQSFDATIDGTDCSYP